MAAGPHSYVDQRDWPMVNQLPACAPDLNPVEGLRSVLRRISLANRAFIDPDDVVTTVSQGLRQLHYRPDVLDGCLAGHRTQSRTTTTTSKMQAPVGPPT